MFFQNKKADESEIRQEVKRLLEQYGYQVRESISFEQIKEEILMYAPDFIELWVHEIKNPITVLELQVNNIENFRE